MAAQVLVNPNTVGKAYRELELMGVVAGRQGAGVFVTREGPRKARRERRAATWKTLEEAVRSARQSGHPVDEILQRVSAWLSEVGEEGIRDAS